MTPPTPDIDKHDKIFGQRCEIKDLVEFPDLKEDERCFNCLVWEEIDAELHKTLTKLLEKRQSVMYRADNGHGFAVPVGAINELILSLGVKDEH